MTLPVYSTRNKIHKLCLVRQWMKLELPAILGLDFSGAVSKVGKDTCHISHGVLRSGGVIVSLAKQPHPELMKKYGFKAI